MLILGAGGKMGPSLARMAARAARAAGSDTRVYAASRFPDRALRDRLTGWGITALVCDLTQPGAIGRLPYCSNVVFMAGRKFGSSGNEWDTWASNVFLASEAARAFPRARMVAFSTGNVYPFWPVARPEGPDEETRPDPVGEYAQSCLGRERMFEYFSRRNGTLVTLLRLNYAVELRYGVLLDIAIRVWAGRAHRSRHGLRQRHMARRRQRLRPADLRPLLDPAGGAQRDRPGGAHPRRGRAAGRAAGTPRALRRASRPPPPC